MPYKVTFTVIEDGGRIIAGDTCIVDSQETAEQEVKDSLEMCWNTRLRGDEKRRDFKEITSIVPVPVHDDLDGDDMFDDDDYDEDEEEYDFNFNDD